MTTDSPRYDRFGKGSDQPVLKLSQYENDLWQKQIDNEKQYLYHLQQFISTASEHIAQQLIPVYEKIRKSNNIEELEQLTVHERSVVRIAAIQKIEMLTGYSPKNENVDQGYARWPGTAWQAPRKPS